MAQIKCGSKKKPFYRRRWVWVAVIVLACLAVVVGPWPAYDTTYQQSDYAAATERRLDNLPLETTRGPLSANVATVDITPPVGEPMAGFGGRSPKESTGIGSRVAVKAISISNGRRVVTIVGGDILLVMPQLRDAVLDRVHLPREEVFFTASHTHSGPGGYSSRWVDQFALGGFDQKILDRLADAFAKAIIDSRRNLSPAELSVAMIQQPTADADTAIRSRFDNSPAISQVAVVRLEQNGKTLAILASFNAHPTCLGKSNHQIDSDYPGLVEADLSRATGAPTLFAAGAVASVKPVLSGNSAGIDKAENWVARHVTSVAMAAMRNERRSGGSAFLSKWVLPEDMDSPAAAYIGDGSPQACIAAGMLEVDLPPQQWRISENWRLSPIAAGYLHDRKTYIHVLRINELVLLGMPADYSTELSARLVAGRAWRNSPLVPVVTSFNGDYVGYLVPHERYKADNIETRSENLFGPWCGDYFNDLSEQLLDRLELSHHANHD